MNPGGACTNGHTYGQCFTLEVAAMAAGNVLQPCEWEQSDAAEEVFGECGPSGG